MKKGGDIDDWHERCNEATHNCSLDGGYRLRSAVGSLAGERRGENRGRTARRSAFITKDATVLYWRSERGGEYQLLRKGSNEWTCLPAIPGYPHDAIDSAFKTEPECYDPIFLRWMQDSLAGRRPHIDGIGISYMYLGLWKYAKGGSGHDFHVGPHLMIVGPHQDEFQGFNRDATNGMPYVTHLPNRTELFLVMPVRQWNE